MNDALRTISNMPRPPHRTRTTADGNLSQVVCREVPAREIDWVRGALAVVALIAALAAVERNDRYTQEQAAHAAAQAARVRAEQAAAADRAALAKANDSPMVRLDLTSPDGILCDQFHIRQEWKQSIGERCMALGQLIIAARMKD